MKKKSEVARDIVDALLKPLGSSRNKRIQLATLLAQHLEDSYQPILPSSNETCVVASDSPKTAALFFDRVWAPPNGGAFDIPKDILFFGGSEPELWLFAASLLRQRKANIDPHLTDDSIASSLRNSLIADHVGSAFGAEADFSSISKDELGTTVVSNILFSTCRIHAPPMFDDAEQMDREFKSGNSECIFAAITSLDIVNEKSLGWEQVA